MSDTATSSLVGVPRSSASPLSTSISPPLVISHIRKSSSFSSHSRFVSISDTTISFSSAGSLWWPSFITSSISAFSISFSTSISSFSAFNFTSSSSSSICSSNASVTLCAIKDAL
uniref:Uncharacterized protein n=1 Tax=Cacopsylla melanoneura TaxID=428564 RepID=A0A8D9F689_9HEMI